MSQVTEVYFLKTTETQDAVDLIKRASQKGCVLPEKNGWVTFVVETKFAHSEISSHNEGVLLYLVMAEDFEWQFTLFYKSKQAVFYRCVINSAAIMSDFDIEEPRNAPELSLKEILMYDRSADWNLIEKALANFEDYAEKKEVIEKLILPEKHKTVIHTKEAYRFCEDMGLFFYDWISYHYIGQNDELHYGKYGTFPIIHV